MVRQMSFKMPYIVTVRETESMAPEEVAIAARVDSLMRLIHVIELKGDVEGVNDLVQKHVEKAYEYYADYSMKEICMLDLIERLVDQDD